MGDKELLNRARNDKSAKESELSFTNPVNRVAPSLFIESMLGSKEGYKSRGGNQRSG